jgi:hypothetical protein
MVEGVMPAGGSCWPSCDVDFSAMGFLQAQGGGEHDFRVGHRADMLQRLFVFTRRARRAAIPGHDDIEVAHIRVMRGAKNAAVGRKAGENDG